MSRMIHRLIVVHEWYEDEPRCFSNLDERHTVVEVIDRWMEMGNWWQGEGERKMMCVWTDKNALFELEQEGRQWLIYKTWD